MVSGCTSEDGNMLVQERECMDKLITTSRFRSESDARNIAQQAIDALGSRGRSGLTLKASDGVTVVCSPSSRAGENDTLMYALDLEDDNGFVLIAGPSTISPLLAVVESGSYSAPENKANGGYQYVMNETKEFLKKEIDRLPITPMPLPYWEVDSLNYLVPPSVQLSWDQFWPANAYCPDNALSGCVPLASAMIMSVFELPKTISYGFAERDIESETLNWTEIKKHKKSPALYFNQSQAVLSHLSECEASMAIHKTIGRIVRQAGMLCYASYGVRVDEFGNKETSVSDKNLYNALDKYLVGVPTKDGSSTWTMYLDLHSYQAAMVTSADSQYGGHAWIADGVWRVGMKKYYYEPVGYIEVPKPGETVGEYKLVKTEGEIFDLMHYNWGWGGNCNGWFIRTAKVIPTEAHEYDDDNKYLQSSFEFSMDVTYRCYGKR